MAHKYYDATIIKIINESDLVKRYFIKMPPESEFHFKAGQFIMLHLPIESKVPNRSYSIASAPSDDRIFEICIILKQDGLGTPYIFENFQEGTHVKVSKALGKFFLPEVIDHDLCFIATGTGIAPLRSQLWDLVNKKLPHQNIYMIFGNRWEKDIIYRKELEDLQLQKPEFRFIPVLSRSNEGWKGKNGYVHAIYEELFADKRPAFFYICGWSEMLNEARHRLKEMGYDKQYIKFESYD